MLLLLVALALLDGRSVFRWGTRVNRKVESKEKRKSEVRLGRLTGPTPREESGVRGRRKGGKWCGE